MTGLLLLYHGCVAVLHGIPLFPNCFLLLVCFFDFGNQPIIAYFINGGDSIPADLANAIGIFFYFLFICRINARKDHRSRNEKNPLAAPGDLSYAEEGWSEVPISWRCLYLR